MLKLVVLDANAFWTEQLFRQCGTFAEVLLLKPREFRAHRRIAGQWRSDSAPQPVAQNVWQRRLAMPPGWMVELWPWTQRRLTRAIRAFFKEDPLTLVITYPQYRALIPALRPTLSVYYNLDDYRDNWPRHRARVPDWEAETVDAANLTVCIADHRVKLLSQLHPAKLGCIHHLPLGCTPEFMAALDSSKTAKHLSAFPSALRSLPRPLAGYIGALNCRFDFAFVANVAARLPDVTFALGGRVIEDGDASWSAGLRRARAAANIHFLGWVDHAQLGDHLQAFDALMMPYAHCNFNTNACPAKLWDYLGTGKPIVANDANPETLLWREVVRIAATPETFAETVREVLADQDHDARERRLEIARAHTWEQLSFRLKNIMESVDRNSTR